MSLHIGMKTPVSVLQEHLLRIGHVPQYDLVRDDTGTHIPTFTYRLQIDNHVVEGTGSSKKEAKQITAQLMLKALDVTGEEAPKVKSEETVPIKKVNKYNSVGALTDYCISMKMQQGPVYYDVREEGPPHAKLFTVRCVVSQLSETAVSGTKKQAKQLAAQQMLTKLKDLHVIDEENMSPAPGSFVPENLVINPTESSKTSSIDPELLEKVITHFKALKSFTSQHICGSSISRYHKIFKSESVASETVVNFVSRLKNAHPEPWDLPPFQQNYEELFKEITTEMGVEGTFSEIPSKKGSQVILNVNHSPPVTFLGLDSTTESAKRKTMIDYLNYLCVLVS